MELWNSGLRVLEVPLFRLADTPVTLLTVLGLLLSVLLLTTAARWVRRRLIVGLLARSGLDPGTRLTIATLAQYLMLLVGFSAILQNAGIKLSAFSVLAGAIGVGLGFGLQNVVSNFVSGLIVMFERPVRIGDRIEIGGIEGEVVAINARSTVLRTQRGATAIVPNQKFITEYVRNWSSSDGATALSVSVKLARDQAPDAAQALLLEAAATLRPALAARAPETQLLSLDASGLVVELLVWVHADIDLRARLQAALLVAVRERLQQASLRLV